MATVGVFGARRPVPVCGSMGEASGEWSRPERIARARVRAHGEAVPAVMEHSGGSPGEAWRDESWRCGGAWRRKTDGGGAT